MNLVRYLEKRIRGWLPKEPSLAPRNRMTKKVEVSAEDKRNQWKIYIVNGIMVGTFFVIHFLIDPHNENIEFTVISWTIFALSLISVDFSLYKYFKRKKSSQLEKLRQ